MNCQLRVIFLARECLGQGLGNGQSLTKMALGALEFPLGFVGFECAADVIQGDGEVAKGFGGLFGVPLGLGHGTMAVAVSMASGRLPLFR